jgi:hypothetical protein
MVGEGVQSGAGVRGERMEVDVVDEASREIEEELGNVRVVGILAWR